MSKFWFNINIEILKNNLKRKNNKNRIFSDIEYFYREDDSYEDLKKSKIFFNELISFVKQLEPIKKDFGIKLFIDMSNEKRAFSYDPYEKSLKICINSPYLNIKEVLNHEFLHILDYYNGKNFNAFSEMFSNIQTKKKNNIYKIQHYILNGEKIKEKNNENSILNFDLMVLRESLSNLFKLYNKKITAEEIEMLTISNLRVFNKFLDSMNILKGQYYLFDDKNSGESLIFDLNKYIGNKNRLLKEYDNLYDNIDHFEKRFLNICKKYNIYQQNVTYNLLPIMNLIIAENFQVFLENGLSTTKNLFKDVKLFDIDEVRNIYYTPTLDILIKKPNSLLIERIIETKQKKAPFYLFTASEKISYCGQKNEGNLLNTFVKLSLNKEHKIKFSKQPTSEDYEQLSEDAEKAFVRFIKKKNEYIDYDPVLNIKNKKQKSITPKTNAPVVFCNPNKNPNTPKRDSVIQNIIKKQQLQKSTVQDQNIEVEKNKKPKI